MRINVLNTFAGVIGLAAIASSAPAVSYGVADTTCTKPITVYLAVPVPTTVYVTINCPGTQVSGPLTTFTGTNQNTVFATLTATTLTEVVSTVPSSAPSAASSAIGGDDSSVTTAYPPISYGYTITRTAVITVTTAYVPALASSTPGGSFSYYVDNGTTLWIGGTPVPSQSDVYATQYVTVSPVGPSHSAQPTSTITSTIESNVQSTIQHTLTRTLPTLTSASQGSGYTFTGYGTGGWNASATSTSSDDGVVRSSSIVSSGSSTPTLPGYSSQSFNFYSSYPVNSLSSLAAASGFQSGLHGHHTTVAAISTHEGISTASSSEVASSYIVPTPPYANASSASLTSSIPDPVSSTGAQVTPTVSEVASSTGAHPTSCTEEATSYLVPTAPDVNSSAAGMTSTGQGIVSSTGTRSTPFVSGITSSTGSESTSCTEEAVSYIVPTASFFNSTAIGVMSSVHGVVSSTGSQLTSTISGMASSTSTQSSSFRAAASFTMGTTSYVVPTYVFPSYGGPTQSTSTSKSSQNHTFTSASSAMSSPHSTTSSSTSTNTLSHATTSSSSAESATPTKCGEQGDFTLNFDDIPQEGNNSKTAAPVFNPYHQFDFSDGFTVGPPPTEKYVPSSPSELIEFVPNFNAAGNNTQSGPNTDELDYTGQISDGDHALAGCFTFNFYGASFGCDSTSSGCDFTFTGGQYNVTTGNETIVATQKASTAACSAPSKCVLERVTVQPIFEDLNFIRINATVSGVPKIWWMDDLELGWFNNTCSAGLCRQSAHIH